MTDQKLAMWQPPVVPAVLDAVSNPQVIADYAIQLRDRERKQVSMNFEAGNYELAATFIWTRTIALLKKQLASLGSAFIGELLQRPDIDEYSDVSSAVSDAEAISLARDLGILTPLQTMRLLHSQEIIVHFAGATNDPSSDEMEIMTQEDAISCLRVCVQGVLGHENIGAAEDFKVFRSSLSDTDLAPGSPEVVRLLGSPYFFKRTAVSVLLSLFKTSKGAQLEHAARNALTIIPNLWDELKGPERWQVGQAYAVEFSEGRKSAVQALHAVLVAVKGFDYVPENLRSSTFIEVASKVIAAHQAMNNFYNEPAPMRELANLGTSIPSPALAACITATLCVKLGNPYGVSNAAQYSADQVLAGISNSRWVYYLDGRLEQDQTILRKLTEHSPRNRWIALIRDLSIQPNQLTSKEAKALITATNSSNAGKVEEVASRMYRQALGMKN